MGVITELARRAPTMMIPSATSPLLFFYEMRRLVRRINVVRSGTLVYNDMERSEVREVTTVLLIIHCTLCVPGYCIIPVPSAGTFYVYAVMLSTGVFVPGDHATCDMRHATCDPRRLSVIVCVRAYAQCGIRPA